MVFVELGWNVIILPVGVNFIICALLDKTMDVRQNRDPMGKSVLYIDDDQAWLLKVSKALTAAGHEVIMAQNSSEALPHTEGVNVGLIILDTKLVGEDSMLLLKFLKHNHPDVPVLLYSEENHDDATVETMVQQGADQYLVKGSMEELIVTAGYYFR